MGFISLVCVYVPLRETHTHTHTLHCVYSDVTLYTVPSNTFNNTCPPNICPNDAAFCKTGNQRRQQQPHFPANCMTGFQSSLCDFPERWAVHNSSRRRLFFPNASTMGRLNRWFSISIPMPAHSHGFSPPYGRSHLHAVLPAAPCHAGNPRGPAYARYPLLRGPDPGFKSHLPNTQTNPQSAASVLLLCHVGLNG